MAVLLTCKNEKIKNESARGVRLYINSSDAQGQITAELALGSGGNLNSFKFSCMSSLPASIDDSIKNEWARVVTTFFPL